MRSRMRRMALPPSRATTRATRMTRMTDSGTHDQVDHCAGGGVGHPELGQELVEPPTAAGAGAHQGPKARNEGNGHGRYSVR